MGGDGGTKAVQRNYLRGAGLASSGDAARKQSMAEAKLVANHEAERSMTHCALKDQPLDYDEPIIACPYGLLYQKEAAIEALLSRKDEGTGRRLGEHVRGLKDLVDVKFHIKENKPVCPVTGRVLNGQVPSFVMSGGSTTAVNVVSEYAIAQLGDEEIANEYGNSGKLRLIPTPDELDAIKVAVEVRRKRKKKKQKEKNMQSKRKKS